MSDAGDCNLLELQPCITAAGLEWNHMRIFCLYFSLFTLFNELFDERFITMDLTWQTNFHHIRFYIVYKPLM